MKDLFKNKTVWISAIYALIQTVYCIIACVYNISALFSVLVAVVLLAGYFVVIFLVNRNREIAKKPLRTDPTLAYKTISNSLYELADSCYDSDLKFELKTIADDFRFADPVSNAKTCDIEAEIINLIVQIKNCLSNGDIRSSAGVTAKLRVAISTRNRLCKTNK